MTETVVATDHSLLLRVLESVSELRGFVQGYSDTNRGLRDDVTVLQSRVRDMEISQSTFVTNDDVAVMEATRRAEVATDVAARKAEVATAESDRKSEIAAALVESDRKANRRILYFGLGVSAVSVAAQFIK